MADGEKTRRIESRCSEKKPGRLCRQLTGLGRGVAESIRKDGSQKAEPRTKNRGSRNQVEIEIVHIHAKERPPQVVGTDGAAPESSRSWGKALFWQRRQRALGRRTGARRELGGGTADGRHIVWMVEAR